jgi:membrane protease YdiL (CAAX protease family)
MPSLTENETLEFACEKVTGVVLTGIVPALLFIVILRSDPSGIGFTAGMISRIKYPLVILLIIIPFLTFYSSKNPRIHKISPELRTKTWHFHHVALSLSCWLVYLFGYEFFFRGILWFLCFNALGFWWALAINIALYSIVHIPKGPIMTWGAIPLGTLLCFLTSITGSFLPAFLIHSTMALSTELFSVYNNPEFQFHVNKQL